jgi:hypothetical protein
MSMMQVMDPTGHTEVSWNSDNTDEVRVARETFDRMTGQGYRAFRTDGKGAQGTRMSSFDPTAESLVLVPHLQGG